jgi:hypothetical protein
MAPKVKEPKEVVRLVDYSKDLSAAILQVKKDDIKLKHKIHNVALSIITAWGKGQIKDQAPADYFNALCDAAGYHAKALGRWMELKLKGKLAFSDENDKWYVMADAKVNGDDFKACRDEPFWEISPPESYEPSNFQALLESLINKNAKASSPEAIAKRKERAEKDGKEYKDKLIPLDVARKMKELLAQLG